MRRVRDSRLPEPFRGWIDRTQPLPPGVVLLPRVIDLSSQVWGTIYTTFIFAVMTGLFVFMMSPLWHQPNFGGIGMILLALLFAAVLIGIPILVWRKLWQAYWAHRDRQAGVLRQGILVGPPGLLVRMSPNVCYPIPIDQFKTAKEFSSTSDENNETWIVLELSKGEVSVYADRLTVIAATVNEAVKVARRGK